MYLYVYSSTILNSEPSYLSSVCNVVCILPCFTKPHNPKKMLNRKNALTTSNVSENSKLFQFTCLLTPKAQLEAVKES